MVPDMYLRIHEGSLDGWIGVRLYRALGTY